MNAVYKALLGCPATLDTLAVASTLLVVASGSLLAYLLCSRPSAPMSTPQVSSAAQEVPTATASSLKKRGPYRRPLARSQRHDSSSTLPPPSAPSLTASTLSSSKGRRSSLADTASLTGFSVSDRTASIAASKQQVEEGEEDDDISAVAPDQGVQPETPPAPQSAAPAAEGQLFVPLAAPAATRPLQAVSAPLSGLPLSPSSSQGVVSVQSLSDPTVSVAKPSKTPTPQAAQLPATVLLQAANHAAQRQPGAAGAGPAAGSSKRPAADAAGRSPSSGGRQQHDSAQAATLDLAAVLAPDPRAAAGRMLPAAAAVASSSSTATPVAPSARVAPPTSLGVRPIGTCLPAAPWSPGHVGAAAGQGAVGSASSNLLYGAAPARPLPTSSLYKSPLAHVTLSVKVPHQFTPSAASNLQSMVARHVWAGEPQLAGPNGEPRDPQHTILHMVSVPGCIQLFLTVAQWQPEHGAPAEVLPHALAEASNSSQSGPEADPQKAAAPAAAAAAGDATSRAAPAPAWLIQAVCSAVEEFCRTNPQEPTPADGSSGAGQQAEASAQHYTGPVLLSVDGVVHTLQPDATNPAAAWVLQALSEQELTQLQAGPHFSTALPSAAAAVASATAQGQPPVLWQGSRAAAAVAGSSAGPPASPVPETPAVTAAAPAARTPLTQLLGSPQPPSSSAASLDSSTSAHSSSPAPAAARTFIRTVAQGLVAMHEQGSDGLFAPTASDSAVPSSAAAQAASTSRETAELASGSSSSLPRTSAVLSIHTSCAPVTALPPGVWGWPLYLATSGEGAASVDARLAVCGSSAVVPVVSLHGVPAGQAGTCRVVLATAAGAVLFDQIVPVEDGVARFCSPESAATMAAKIFYLLPTASASAPGAAAPSAPVPARPSATSTAAAAAATAMPAAAASASASPAAPADQLLCMLPLLYLPPDAVMELCEAARALMLERSNLMFAQQLQRQQQEREQEQLQAQQHAYASGSTLEDDSYYAGALDLSASHHAHTGCLSFTARDAAVREFAAAAQAPAGRPAQGESTAAAAARIQHAASCSPVRLGTPAELHRAAAGSSSHEGSFDTTPVASAASYLPAVRKVVAEGASGSDPAAAAPAAAQVPASYPQQQQQQQQLIATPNRRTSIEAGSGNSSIFDSRTGLEDEPGQLNLRGRLFEGSSDVHQLLNSQFLAILADLGLLIELASSSSSSSSGGGGIETQHASMAAEVGQQLLVWFMDTRCWSCCQLVLRLLLDLRVHLHLHGQPVTAASIASVPAVQQLLQVAAAPNPAVLAAAPQQQQLQLPVVVPTPISGIGRAGVWGHLPPPEFLPAARQSLPQPGVSSVPPAQQPPTEALFGGGSSSAGRDNSTNLAPSSLPAGSQHQHTSSSSTSASYVGCESSRPGEAAAAAPRLPPAVAAAPRAAPAWPPYTPTVLSSAAAATAAERVAVEQQQAGPGGVGEGEAQPSGHGSRRLLDSASEIWTRIRRHSTSSKLREH